jgi:hypothetical protein
VINSGVSHLFLLTLFGEHGLPIYSLRVTKGGHMNHPAKNMAMLKHLESNSIRQLPAELVE